MNPQRPHAHLKPTESGATAFLQIRSWRFFLFWGSNLLSNTGTWMQEVAQPWLVLNLSHSSVLLGIDSFAGDIPVWVFTLFGGFLADHYDRKRLILGLQALQMLCPIVLIILIITQQIQVWEIILCSAIVGITDALSGPAIQALLPSLVEKSEIGRAVAWNSTQFNLSRVLGPFFAGTVIASLGVLGCFSLNALSYLPFLFGIFIIYAKPFKRSKRKTETFSPREMRSAVRTLLKNPVVLHSLLRVSIASVLCGPVVTFIPVLTTDFYHKGAGGFGGAVSVLGVGGLLGSAALLLHFGDGFQARLATMSYLLLGLSLVGISTHVGFLPFLVLLLIAGLTMTAGNTLTNTCIQTEVHEDFRGRASSLYALAMRGGLAFGSLLTGLSIAQLGVGRALLINGCVAFVLQLGMGFYFKLENQSPKQHAS
jgi:MFS family permease